MTNLLTSYTKTVVVAAMCLLMSGGALAQCRHHYNNRPCTQSCQRQRCHVQQNGFRPSFNSSVGVPIRWVNVPTPYGNGYGYGYGNGYGYGYTRGPVYRGNRRPRYRGHRNRYRNSRTFRYNRRCR